MPWFKSDNWREILALADQWRAAAGGYIDDPGPHASPKLAGFTYGLMKKIDAENVKIDSAPLWDTFTLIQGHQKRLPSSGNPARLAEIRASMTRAIGVLERLRLLGVVSEEPKQQPSDANNANTSHLFSGDVPANSDIVDLVVRLDCAKGSGKSDRQIALEFTGKDVKKAESLLAQIRRLKRQGRVIL